MSEPTERQWLEGDYPEAQADYINEMVERFNERVRTVAIYLNITEDEARKALVAQLIGEHEPISETG